MNEPKDQHFVAQFHLRNWCGDKDKLLQCYRWLPNGRFESKRRSTKEVCHELHLYSLEIPNTEFKYIAEEVFQKLETHSAPIAEKLLQGASITSDEERSMWTCYLLAQRVRVKSALTEYLKRCQPVIDENLSQIDSEEIASKQDANLPASIISALKENIPGLSKNIPMLSMIDFLVGKGKNQDVLINMKWQVVDTSGVSHKLLTSDQPIIYTAGLKEPNAEVIFPLTPSKVFIACNNPNLKKVREIARLCNDRMVRGAQNAVIAYDDTQRLFIERRLVVPTENSSNPILPAS